MGLMSSYSAMRLFGGSMHRSLVAVVALMVVALASCATSPAWREATLNAACGIGGDDRRPWSPLNSPPANAEVMRAAVRAAANSAYHPPAGEFWFSLPSGEIKLCHADPTLRDLCRSEWSEFRPGPGGPVLDPNKSSEIICVS